MLYNFFAGTLLTVGLLCAQDVSSSPASILPGEPNPGQPFANKELREYLSLTDAQASALQGIQRQRWEADAAQWRTITQKEAELYDLLRNGATDAFRVGQLMIEIHNLRQRTGQPSGDYKEQALRVLNPQQTAKLHVLANALQLQFATWQAVGLNLLDGPNRGRAVPVISTRPAENVSFAAPANAERSFR